MSNTPKNNDYKDKYEHLLKTMDLHIKVITIIIISVSLIIGIFSILSFNKISDSANDLINKYIELSTRIDEKFDRLSGQTFKEPKLEIFYRDKNITDKTITINTKKDSSYIILSDLVIKNTGTQAAKFMEIKLYISESFIKREHIEKFFQSSTLGWIDSISPENNYKELLELSRGYLLPKDKLKLPGIKLFFNNHDNSDIEICLVIFYDFDEPSKTSFVFKFIE